MSLDRRLGAARQAVNDLHEADPMTWLKPTLLRFAQGTLPWEDALALIGQAQLNEWRRRFVNLVKWQRFDRARGMGPGAGEAIQTAIEIASYPPDEDLPQDYTPEIDRFRDAYLDDTHFLNEQYLVYALLATTLLDTPDGMALRCWLDEHEPGIWTADPDPTVPPGYDVAIRIGGQNRPQLAVRAICEFEEPDPDAETPSEIKELWQRWTARQ